jgi:hypothetical protein
MFNKNTIIQCIIFTILFIIIYFLIYIFSYKILKYFFKEKIEGFTAEINQAQQEQKKAKQIEKLPTNIILLGDSILNNTTYVKKEETIQELLLDYTKTSKLYYMPKDEAVIADIYDQFANIPADLDNPYFVLSVGGNDILKDDKKVKNVFSKYKKLVKAIQTRFPASKLFLMNVYLPPTITPAQKTAITEWNSLLYDYVTDPKNNIKSLIAINYKLNQKDDFINDLEPSFQGGKKIVELIITMLSSS